MGGGDGSQGEEGTEARGRRGWEEGTEARGLHEIAGHQTGGWKL